MKPISFFGLSWACLYLFSSCKKTDTSSDRAVKDIYLAGPVRDIPANGQPLALTNGATSAFVNCIEVFETDLYPGGTQI